MKSARRLTTIGIQIERMIKSRSIEVSIFCITMNFDYRHRRGYYWCQRCSCVCIVMTLLVAVLLAAGIAALALTSVTSPKASKKLSDCYSHSFEYHFCFKIFLSQCNNKDVRSMDRRDLLLRIIIRASLKLTFKLTIQLAFGARIMLPKSDQSEQTLSS